MGALGGCALNRITHRQPPEVGGAGPTSVAPLEATQGSRPRERPLLGIASSPLQHANPALLHKHLTGLARRAAGSVFRQGACASLTSSTARSAGHTIGLRIANQLVATRISAAAHYPARLKDLSTLLFTSKSCSARIFISSTCQTERKREREKYSPPAKRSGQSGTSTRPRVLLGRMIWTTSSRSARQSATFQQGQTAPASKICPEKPELQAAAAQSRYETQHSPIADYRADPVTEGRPSVPTPRSCLTR